MAYTTRSYSSSGSSTGSVGSGTLVRNVRLNRRPPPAKLGFSLRGGKEHGTGFFVTAVEPESEAFHQGLIVGDQILRVNNFPVDDATHKEVLQLIQGQSVITLKVKAVGMIPVKESPEDELSWQIVDPVPNITSPPRLPDLCKSELSDDPRAVTDVKLVLRVPPRAKLGCGICKGPEWKPGVFVQFTKENSIARLAGLRPGDQILQCNNFTFTPETPFTEAVTVMRCSGILELLVKKGAGTELFPGESSGYNSSASSVAGDPPPRQEPSLEEATNGKTKGNSNGVHETHRVPNRAEYTNGCTVIRVGGAECDNPNKKIAEICMVSQQLETKTTTVFVEVHHSEEDGVSHTQSEASTDRLTNSSSVSSFTSSASSLSSAISQELERRSKRPLTTHEDRLNKPSEKLIKSGLAKEKVQQHEQLMEEFKKAHRKMFSGDCPDPLLTNQLTEEREEARLTLQGHKAISGDGTDCSRVDVKKDVERLNSKTKRQSAPPPPPPLPVQMENEDLTKVIKPASTKKYPAPSPPNQGDHTCIPDPPPLYCPTPDYDTTSTTSDEVDDNTRLVRKINNNNNHLRNDNNNNNKDHHERKGKNCQINGKTDKVEMQSLESFKLTNPNKVKPRPPSTYFTATATSHSDASDGSTASTLPMKEKPIVTIREYPDGRDRRNPTKFDFLQNIDSPQLADGQPIACRLQDELSQTLSRAFVLSKNECQTSSNGASNGTVVTINVNKPQPKTESAKPFYLFPNGNVDAVRSKKIATLIQSAAQNVKNNDNGVKNSVTFNFSKKTAQEARIVNGVQQPNGILKNGNNPNVSQVRIQSHINCDQQAPQKSIKFC